MNLPPSLPIEGGRPCWVGRPAKGTGASFDAPTRPAKNGPCAQLHHGMKKSRHLFMVRLLHLLSGLPNPCTVSVRLAIICELCYLQEKSGALQQLPAGRFCAMRAMPQMDGGTALLLAPKNPRHGLFADAGSMERRGFELFTPYRVFVEF